MAIIITPSIVEKAASRLIARNVIQEQSTPPGREAHIFNLYEDLSMPLKDIIEIGRLALDAKVENIQEKMDGQYFGFTVRDGVLRVFTKLNLVTDKQLENLLSKIQNEENPAGMDLNGIREKFGSDQMSGVREAFSVAYEALEQVALPYQNSLFKNGEVVIAAQVMHESSQNTIAYNENSLRFVGPISLNAGEPVSTSDLIYQEFLNQAREASRNAFTLDSVPVATLIQDLESDDSVIDEEEERLATIISDYNLSENSTVGDFVRSAVIKKIQSSHPYIPERFLEAVADRFATGKGRVGIELKKVLSRDDYARYRRLDARKRLIVDEAIIPLEEIIQRIGISVISKLNLALSASNRDDLIGFVDQVRNAFEEGFDFGLGPDDSDVFEKIRVALARLEANKDLFSIASEGIVFTHNNNTYKLTGLFTPINKLRGFFAYGKASLPEEEVLSEGGGAFKDSTGTVITRTDRISRSEVSRILDAFDSAVLQSAGVKYLPVGSTATNTETVGDLDIVVDIASKDVLFKILVDEMGPENVKKMAQLIAVKFQVPGSDSDDYVQIDVIPSASVEDTAWVMKGGTEGSVKGVFRNLLFSYIARTKSDQESNTMKQVKYSLSWPGGLLVKINGEPTGPREGDPDNFLPALGIDVPKEQVSTFEDLVSYMRRTPAFSSILPGFRDYIDNTRYLQSKNDRSREAAEAAIRHIEVNEMNESLALKEIIRKLLLEETETDDVESSAPEQPEQLRLFTPAYDAPLASITPSWLGSHSVSDEIYDDSTGTFHEEGVPALLMGYEDASMENEGEKFEIGMIEYTKFLGIPGMERVGGEGEDLRLGNRTYESKKSKTSSPNLMFNSTFPKSRPGHFYLFSTDVPSSSIIRNVSNKLKSSLGINGRWSELSQEDKKRLSDAWISMRNSENTARSDLLLKIEKIEELINNQDYWSGKKEIGKHPSGRRKFAKFPAKMSSLDTPDIEADEEASDDDDQYSLFEAAKLDGIVFETPKELKAYKKTLESQLGSAANPGPLSSTLQALGANLKVFLVPSSELRVAIMQSAFPGSFQGKNQIFDPATGAIVPGGDQKIVDAIKQYLDNFGLEYKIAKKIAPELIKDLVDGLPASSRFEDGWSMNMGLLGVRVKIYIEPKGTKDES